MNSQKLHKLSSILFKLERGKNQPIHSELVDFLVDAIKI